MDVLRRSTMEGVLKESALFVLIYNLIRRIMCEAAHRQDVEPDRISFIDACAGYGMHVPATRCPLWSSSTGCDEGGHVTMFSPASRRAEFYSNPTE